MAHDGLTRRRFIASVAVGAAGLALSRLPSWGQAAEQPLYSFIALADAHLREDREGELTGVEKFRRALEAMRGLQPQPESMLMLGDIHPEKLEPLLPEVPMPIYPVAGNHETRAHREALRAMFPDVFQGKDFYTVERGDDLFIGMCTARAGDHVGTFESQDITPGIGQCEWITEQLARREQFARVFMFGHIPPEQQARPSGMCLEQNDSRWLLDVVAQTHPTALFFGHRHYRVWFDVDGVPVYGLRSCNWNSKGEPVGFLHVKVFADRLEVEFVDTTPPA